MLTSLTAAWLVLAAGSTSPYEVDWVTDGVALVAINGLMYLSTNYPLSSLTAEARCPRDDSGACDPAELSRLDRGVVGNRSATWGHVSDLSRDGAKLLAAGAVAADAFSSGSSAPLGDALRDGLVIGVAVSAAELTTHVLKYAIARPRPLEYDASTMAGTPARQRSMPSGHVTAAAEVSAAYGATFAYRHPESPWRFAVAGAGVALTATTAYGRVRAGQHFYSDVLAGAAVGTAIGLLVPRAYLRGAVVAPTVMEGGAGVVLGAEF